MFWTLFEIYPRGTWFAEFIYHHSKKQDTAAHVSNHQITERYASVYVIHLIQNI